MELVDNKLQSTDQTTDQIILCLMKTKKGNSITKEVPVWINFQWLKGLTYYRAIEHWLLFFFF